MESQIKKHTSIFKQLGEILFILLMVFFIRTVFFGLYRVPTGSMETTMLVGEFFFADKFTYLFWQPKRGDILSLNSPLFNYSDNAFIRLFQEYVWGPENVTKRIIGIPGDLVEGKIEDNKPVVYLNGQKLDEPYLNKYPLIAVWKDDPEKIIKSANDQIITLASQAKLNPSQLQDYFQKTVNHAIEYRSYDPALPFDQQPFYRIKESLIYKDKKGNSHILKPGTLIREPEITDIPSDKNFWNQSDIFRVKLGLNQYWLMGDNRLNSGDSRVFGPVDKHLIHGRILFRI